MWFCIANLARQLKHLRLLGRSWDLRAEPLPGNAASFSWQERLNQLRQAFAVFIIAVFAIAKLTAAQAATETTAMKYYVGKWSCVTRPAGHPQLTFANHCPHWLYHHARMVNGSCATYAVDARGPDGGGDIRYGEASLRSNATSLRRLMVPSR